MNRFKTVDDRRAVTDILLKDELRLLHSGYNPIRGTTIAPKETCSLEIEPDTPFILAIRKAFKKLKVGEQSISCIKSALTYIEKASDQLGYSNIEVSKVRRRNISLILETCPKVKKRWSHQTYNHYRAYLMMLFKKLVELEAIESNPVDSNLPKEDVEVNIRELLTLKERGKIEDHFKHDKYFHRFMHIFFHSGARPVELLRLKKEAINVEELYYKIKVRKRKKIVEEKRPIKKIVKHLWQEILEEAKEGDYIFGQGLLPCTIPCPRDYVTDKWFREVKIGLGIKKDFYSLKHSNLDETSAILDAEAASKQAGHKSTVITLKHYLVNEEERQRKRLSEVNNKFA